MSDLSLRQDNPYSNGTVITFDDGTGVLDRDKLNYVPSASDKLHTVTDYDTLSSIANDRYGNSKYWWIIFDINKLDNPFELPIGKSLIIADLLRLKASSL